MTIDQVKESLEVGQKYKYPALCEVFGLKPATGNTKKNHIKTFEQYMRLEKNGTWFTVLEIYDEIQERDDGRKIVQDVVPSKLNNITKDNEMDNFIHPVTQEPIEGEVLSMYQSIINQVDGNTLRDLICKSIINNLFSELLTVGEVGFKDAWFVTHAKLLKNTGLVSPSYDYIKRNPKRFCTEMSELSEDNLNEVLDYLNIDKDWLKKQTSRALKELTNQYHLITYYENAYMLIMKTTRIKDGVAHTQEEYYYPTLDELEWINKSVIPRTLKEHGYKRINQVKYDNKIKDLYQEWIPNCINMSLPTGWGTVKGVYKCHRIGFSKDIIEYAVNNHMRLLHHEREILDELAECYLMAMQDKVTTNRNEQAEKRHEQAVKGTCRCNEETREIRCRESYIGVGYVVNRESHSADAQYTDFTGRKGETKTIRTIVSKVLD